MANWTRENLANLAAGYDAVIEFSESLVGQILAKQTVFIPPVKSQPHSHNAKEIKGLPASAFPSASLTLQPSGGSDIGIIANTVLVSGTGVLIKLTLRNNTNNQLVVAAV